MYRFAGGSFVSGKHATLVGGARVVITNEARAEDQDHSHWMFLLETQTKNSQKEIDEVVETRMAI